MNVANLLQSQDKHRKEVRNVTTCMVSETQI